MSIKTKTMKAFILRIIRVDELSDGLHTTRFIRLSCRLEFLLQLLVPAVHPQPVACDAVLIIVRDSHQHLLGIFYPFSSEVVLIVTTTNHTCGY